MNIISKKYRFFEILPGAMLWIFLIGLLVLSFVLPFWVIVFIIIYDLFWLFRIGYFSFYLVLSWRKCRKVTRQDWLSHVRELKNWEEYYHLIFLPTYKEGYNVVREAFVAIKNSNYPKDKMIVVLPGEERDKENFLEIAEKIKKEFGSIFFKFLITVHPKDLPDEKQGKGSNAHYAGWKAKALVDELKLDYGKVIVSTFDIDTLVQPEYFGYLAHKYITAPNPTRRSFQPIAIYANNIWTSSAIVRVVSFGTTFWLMNELAHPERSGTFSSHSMSFKALVDVGFWDKNVVSEDSRIFLQCLIKYHGDYQIEPLHIPAYMNTVMISKYWQSLKNLYKQQRRWAWGVENIPYMFTRFANDKLTPFKIRLKHLFNIVEGMFSWATAPIFIFVLGRLPLWVAGESVKEMVFVQNTPFILEGIMTLAMMGIFVSALLSFFLLPPKPPTVKKTSYLTMVLQWVLLPVTIIIFGAFPAIDAQTRLMLGKRMGFWVTPKS
ncbi:glycosyltransferase family 2 protein [Patescibacteria group bacterium]|nr:glycosyltransferase family 2 protein [Patescibacteria group bacterium]